MTTSYVVKKFIKDGVEYPIYGTAGANVSTATSSTTGVVKLGSDTVQSVAANNPSSITGKTYPVQFNSSNQMVVNVPREDVNTKTFYLTGTTGSTNIAIAQAAYDWYVAGKNPIISYDNQVYLVKNKTSSQIVFASTKLGKTDYPSSGYSLDTIGTITFNLSSNNVQSIISSNGSFSGKYIATDINYSTPYTPQYDGSPTTKKYVDDRDTYIGSSQPTSNKVEGRLWYDTTNDKLKVYDGTNRQATGKEYNAGKGIEIGDDYSAMQGPCPIGYHVPSKDEWVAVKTVWTALGGGSSDGTNFGIALKLPFAGYRNSSNSNTFLQGTNAYYWSSLRYSASNAYYLNFTSTYINDGVTNSRASGYAIRGFKDSPVVPDNTWTTLKSGTGSAGIFWSSSLGLISMSKDGTTWITIADKNLGATTVWNSGDTLSEANCGGYFQRGNNYMFPFTGTLTDTSTTQVDATNYGPGNYYSSSTFIKYSGSWDSSDNANLRGGATGVISNAINNKGVLSVNGNTGVVTVNDVKVAASAPASPSEGMLWYDTTNDVLKSYNGSNWNAIGGGTDYSWVTKTISNGEIELGLRTLVNEPTGDFTLTAPATIIDGEEYAIRIINNTGYTMTLGTGFTNPNGVNLSLNEHATDQFVFLSVGGVLELQPFIL